MRGVYVIECSTPVAVSSGTLIKGAYALNENSFPAAFISFTVDLTVHVSSSVPSGTIYELKYGGTHNVSDGTMILSLTASQQGFATYSASALFPANSFVDSFFIKLVAQKLFADAVSTQAFMISFTGEEGPVPGQPRYRLKHWDRGIRFGNIGEFPDMDPRDLVHGSSRVHHANSVQSMLQRPSDVFVTDIDGAVRTHFTDEGRKPVPEAVRHYAQRSVNQFGQAAFPWSTGSV